MAVLVRKVWLALAVLVACITVLLLNRDVMLDWDRIQINAERARRLAYAAGGVPLPGTPDLRDFSGRKPRNREPLSDSRTRQELKPTVLSAKLRGAMPSIAASKLG